MRSVTYIRYQAYFCILPQLRLPAHLFPPKYGVLPFFLKALRFIYFQPLHTCFRTTSSTAVALPPRKQGGGKLIPWDSSIMFDR